MKLCANRSPSEVLEIFLSQEWDIWQSQNAAASYVKLSVLILRLDRKRNISSVRILVGSYRITAELLLDRFHP